MKRITVTMRTSTTGLLAAVVLAVAGCGSPQTASNGAIESSLVSKIDATLGGGGGAVAASAAETLGTPDGWATIKGRFIVRGNPPAGTPISMGENKDMCPPATTETVVVGPGGELRNVLIYLEDDIPDDSAEAEPLWTHADYDIAKNADKPADELLPQQRAEVEFDQKNCRFLDHMFAFRSNQAMKILNSDPFGHNTNLETKDKARPFNQTIPAGGSVVYEPGGTEKRPFPVSCAIHPWMSARMIIRENPYFAVSKEDGTFEIRNVPSGVKLGFRVWQEGAEYLEDVELNGEKTTWSKGKLELQLDDGEVRNLDVVVDASAFE
ncbi:MAG: hypothetical protein RIC55_06225 [Pirellulaceae bacterium]